MNLSLGLSFAQSAIGLWGDAQNKKKQAEQYKRNLAIQKALAGEALAITYNSIYNQAMEVNFEARRAEFETRVAARQAAGKAVVQQAATGATGQRVQLATEQATAGAGDRALGRIAKDRKLNLDALINRAESEERATVNRLISGAPDLPSEFDPLVTGLNVAANIYGDVLQSNEFDRKLKEYAASDKIG